MSAPSHEELRLRLCGLGAAIRDIVLASRKDLTTHELSGVTGHAGGDTIYAIDKISEEAIFSWFEANWPADWPVELVFEGLESALCFPVGTSASSTQWKCIIDPIDGTRGIMYDKRSAWFLAGIAPQSGAQTRLSGIVAAVMVEIPTTRQWRSDLLSATIDGPLVSEASDVRNGGVTPAVLHPSLAESFEHGFSSLAKFFPEGRSLTAKIEEELWDELIGLNASPSPTVFDDQYISTGGQFYELLAGHDRMVGDLRPLVFQAIGMPSSLVCHPYDSCAALLLQKAGVVYEHPLGGFPDAPLDTSSPIAWIAYANESLASKARPALRRALKKLLS